MTPIPEWLNEWLDEPLTEWQQRVLEAAYASNRPLQVEVLYRDHGHVERFRRQFFADEVRDSAVDPAVAGSPLSEGPEREGADGLGAVHGGIRETYLGGHVWEAVTDPSVPEGVIEFQGRDSRRWRYPLAEFGC